MSIALHILNTYCHKMDNMVENYVTLRFPIQDILVKHQYSRCYYCLMVNGFIVVLFVLKLPDIVLIFIKILV